MIKLTQQHDDLVSAAVSGDKASLDTLLLRNYDGLLIHIRRQMSSHDLRRFEAEDILQQTHQRVFMSIDQLRGTSMGEFNCWVFRISDNILRDLRRKYSSTRRSGQHGRVSLTPNDDSLNVLLGTLADETPSPSSIAMTKEAKHELLEALETLSDEEKALVELRFFQQQSHAQVADELSMSEHAVRRRCVSTLERLREILGYSAGL